MNPARYGAGTGLVTRLMELSRLSADLGGLFGVDAEEVEEALVRFREALLHLLVKLVHLVFVEADILEDGDEVVFGHVLHKQCEALCCFCCEA